MRRVLTVALLFMSFCAFTCEPCKKPTPEQAFKEADLVIIAQMTDEASKVVDCVDSSASPRLTKLRVSRVLKGNYKSNELSVRACYGMCDYGLILSDTKEHLVFLRATAKDQFETLVCKADELIFEDGKILFDKEKVNLENWLKLVIKN